MRTFKIPVSYEVCGTIDVEAKTLEEAIKYAEDNIKHLPLPDETEYIDGSYMINVQIAEIENEIE